MHITDGALSTPVLIVGGVLAAGGIAMGLRKVRVENIPTAGVLSATFFIASLIHVPVGVTSVHLIMNGLAGIILGWLAFPALFVGLLLQAVFFGFGGVTVLGVNAFNIAMPAVIVFYVYRAGVLSPNPVTSWISSFSAGFASIVLTTIFVAIALVTSGSEFYVSAWGAFGAHIPVMIFEGFVCAAAMQLIRRVRPELLGAIPGASTSRPRLAWAGNLQVIGLLLSLPIGYFVVPAAWKEEHSLIELFTDSTLAPDVGQTFLLTAIACAVVAGVVGFLVGPAIERSLDRRVARRAALTATPPLAS